MRPGALCALALLWSGLVWSALLWAGTVALAQGEARRQLSPAQERLARSLEEVFAGWSRARQTSWRRQGELVAIGFQVRFAGV